MDTVSWNDEYLVTGTYSFAIHFSSLLKCRFNESWTLTDEYTRWISRTKDVHKARCTICLKDIDVIAAWEKVLEN